MKITFTGLTIDSSDLRGKHYSGWRNPLEWSRISVTGIHTFDTEKMVEIAEEHFKGRFATQSGYDSIKHESYVILMFEYDKDAVWFKLMDGVAQCSS